MKGLIALCLILLANSSVFIDFHAQYINKIKHVSQVPKSLNASASCPSFQCTTSPSSWPAGQCLKFSKDKKDFELKTCPDSQFCPWAWHTQDTTTDCITPMPFTYAGMPGDPCKSNAECQGQSVCSNSVCVGNGIDEECDDQPDCDVGLACFNEPRKAKCIPCLLYTSPSPRDS